MLGGSFQLCAGRSHVGPGKVLLSLVVPGLNTLVLRQQGSFAGLQPLVEVGSFLFLLFGHGFNCGRFLFHGILGLLLALKLSAQLLELLHQLWSIFAVERQIKAAAEAGQLTAHKRFPLLGIGQVGAHLSQFQGQFAPLVHGLLGPAVSFCQHQIQRYLLLVQLTQLLNHGAHLRRCPCLVVLTQSGQGRVHRHRAAVGQQLAKGQHVVESRVQGAHALA